MLINYNKLPLSITSIDMLIAEFPEAKQFIDSNQNIFLDDLINGEEDMSILHRICISFFKRQEKHYTILGLKDRILVTEANISNALIIKNKLLICTGEKHLEELYASNVFLHYAKEDPSIKQIAKNNMTFDMAVDIHKRINTLDIRIIQM